MSAIWPKLSGIQGWHWARTVALSLTLFIFGMAQSTAQGTRSHLFRADAPIDAAAAKLAVHAVKGLDANGLVSIEGSTLKVRVEAGVTQTNLLNALNANEQRYVAVNTSSKSSGPAPDSFPQRIDTGDPTGDDLLYDEAKRAWISSYPDAYQLLQSGVNDSPTPSKNP